MKKFKMLKVFMLCLLLTVTVGTSVMYASPTEIVMTCMSGSPYTEATAAVIKSFEASNPNIKVKVEYYPYDQILSLTEIKLSAKSAVPDILFTDVPLVSAYTARGYLLPLDKYYSAKEKKMWTRAALKAVSVKNKLMAAPLNNSSQILYYNKKLFREAGIAPLSKDPKKRLTWDQVVNIAKKIKVNHNIWGIGLQQINRTYQLLAFPESLGAKAISSDGLKTSGIINSSKWVKALQFYQDLFNKWGIAPKGVETAQMPNYFQSGRLAMFVGVEFYTRSFSETSGLEWDYAPHPYFAGGKAVTATGSWCLGVNKYSANKNAAIKFVRYLTTAPGCVEWFKIDGHLPPNQKSLEFIQNDAKFSQDPWSLYKLAAYESAHTAVPRPVTPGY